MRNSNQEAQASVEPNTVEFEGKEVQILSDQTMVKQGNEVIVKVRVINGDIRGKNEVDVRLNRLTMNEESRKTIRTNALKKKNGRKRNKTRRPDYAH